MKTKILYVVGALKEDVTLQIMGMRHEMKLNWIDGMIGTIPVFEKFTDANKYAGDKFKIYKIKVEGI